MTKRILWAAALTACAGTVFAGAKLKIDEQSSIDLGFRVQPLAVITETDLDGDGEFETETDFKVRRARLRLGATVTEQVSAFIQTDLGSTADGAGQDFRVIDAFVTLSPCETLDIIAGENMAPVTRQNLTSSGGMMCIDRPGINFKTLTWGTRSLYAFANRTFGDSDAGFRGDVDVRDLGVTTFSSCSFSEKLHAKCYAGVYDGIQTTTEDNVRVAGRAQVNLFDAEPNYYNLSTYLGKLKTVGVGAAFDHQPEIADDVNGAAVDYTFWTVDAFAELPCGPGSVTLEGAYEVLDLDAALIDRDGDPLTAPTDLRQAEGDGFYVQAGYLVNNVQPWFGYEQWSSDADADEGSYDLLRVGVTYFMKGHNANIKLGYEQFNADTPIGATQEDTINSFVLGCFVTY
jgi:hypothetical protein